MNQKRGNWSPPTPFLGYDNQNRVGTVPGKTCCIKHASVEDIRQAIDHSPLASSIQASIDEMKNALKFDINVSDSNYVASLRPMTKQTLIFHWWMTHNRLDLQLLKRPPCPTLVMKSRYSGQWIMSTILEQSRNTIPYVTNVTLRMIMVSRKISTSQMRPGNISRLGFLLRKQKKTRHTQITAAPRPALETVCKRPTFSFWNESNLSWKDNPSETTHSRVSKTSTQQRPSLKLSLRWIYTILHVKEVMSSDVHHDRENASDGANHILKNVAQCTVRAQYLEETTTRKISL